MAPDFRFGHQLRTTGPIPDLVAEAQQAEAAGFDIVTVPDHIGTAMHSPMLLLAAIARETTSVRLGTFVLNNEMRNPVQLAWEAALLDRVSDGRFELGIGAGHTPHEFAATGIEFRRPAVRKSRLAEAVEIIRGLLNGETVSYSGQHYDVVEAAIEPPVQTRLPIMVAGNGTSLLSHAASHADIIGLNGLGRTQADGHKHSVKFGLDHLDAQVATIEAAQPDGSAPERNALVQMVKVTDNRRAAAEQVASDLDGVTVDEALATPYLAFGTHAEIAEHFRTARERWGISYFVTRDIDAIAPVIERLRSSN